MADGSFTCASFGFSVFTDIAGTQEHSTSKCDRSHKAWNRLPSSCAWMHLRWQWGSFGWWHAVSNEGGDSKPAGVGLPMMRYEGWSETKAWLVSLFQQSAPFDGVFGFSQGAALTSLLVGLRNPGEAESRITFDFAMMVGGFASRDGSHANLYQRKSEYDLPSVHIIGTSDFVVPSSHSDRLASLFRDPLILRHSGGHVVPGDPQVRNSVAAFLQERARDVAASVPPL